MTQAEFLEVFAGVAGQFKWHCTGGTIRCRSTTTWLTMCPLTAYRSTLEDGKEYISSYFLRAAKDLNISKEDANVIAGAADDDWDIGPKKDMRKELIAIAQIRR